MSKSNKREIITSPEYRTLLGKRLREERLKLKLSVSDIVYMTTISDNTINSIEKGITTNIDYYVEYAKAVKYPLQTLKDFGIALKPFRELIHNEKVSLTSKIREQVLKTNFLNENKTVAELREYLLKLKLIDKDITSTDIAGVMRSLLKEGIVTATKQGRKNLYLKK
ncbi:RodZ family helix-turn-helix domain-containing protein [Myroides indicus]|uniref:HTH cro/C1-type domain-containing protein n=1 Tax=Myroides indicus TaxID=1323422 RepID=A0A4R7ETZ5_9FLAO|nr:hypothetical protein [Myroides indicus]TDS56526.1 hypothetical protein C8P70_12019 [Myroides indicus]